MEDRHNRPTSTVKILQFPSPQNLTRRTASGELPTASLVNADDSGVQKQAVEVNPLRLLVRAICYNCRYDWQAPKVGLCPVCGSELVQITGMVPCMAARI